jgi:hypothetical protein
MNECYICAKREICRGGTPRICFNCIQQYDLEESNQSVQEDPTPEVEITDKMLNELFPLMEGP